MLGRQLLNQGNAGAGKRSHAFGWPVVAIVFAGFAGGKRHRLITVYQDDIFTAILNAKVVGSGDTGDACTDDGDFFLMHNSDPLLPFRSVTN